MRLVGISVLVACALEAAAVSAGAVLYVDGDATGSGGGESWSNAYTTLNEALAGSVSGSELWVAEGTYTPTTNGGNRSSTFTVPDGVSLYGGFSGTESNRAERNPETNITILSADLANDDGDTENGTWADMGENSYHVVTVTGGIALLDGVTITRGWSWESSGGNSGGAGLYVVGSTVTLHRCQISDNLAHSGAGMYAHASLVTISNCTFSGNLASDGRGGALYISADLANPLTTTIVDSSFLNNTATVGGGVGDAGAIWSSSGAPVNIDRCLFEGNEAAWRFTYGSFAANGGAIVLFGDGSRIANTTFRGNRAHVGGALWLASAVDIVNCLFVANEAYRQSVGFYDYGGYAGAVYSPGYGSATNVLIANCTFHLNHARTVGGVYAGSGTRIVNSILWSNTSSEEQARLLDMQVGGTPVLNYSVVRGLLESIPGEDPPNPDAHPGCIDRDPVLFNPEGPDGIPGNADDDLRPGAASPCIDAGNNAEVPADELVDFAGNTRFWDVAGIADAGAGTPPIVDMGAYEYGPWQETGYSNVLPVAAFTSTVTGVTAEFTDLSTDLDGDIVEWIWDFGDLTSSTEQEPSHIYLQNGEYAVTLTVRDNEDGSHRSTPMWISITGYPPIAVSITAPLEGSTNTWIVTLAADVSNTGVLTRVKFYIDDVYLDKDESWPFALDWDTRTVSNGTHEIRAKASDGDQVETSQTIDVVVDNQRAFITSPPFDATIDVGQHFQHTVEATGTPSPSFELLSAPEGMTIDTITGIIDWIPEVGQLNFIGDVNVRASNLWASVDQVSRFTVLDTTAPTAPTGIVAVGILADSALLIWTEGEDNTYVDSYQVWYYFKVNQFPGHWKRMTSGLTTQRMMRVSVSSSASYTPKFAVSAFDSSGNESYLSASVSVTPHEPDPPTLTMVPVAELEGSIQFNVIPADAGWMYTLDYCPTLSPVDWTPAEPAEQWPKASSELPFTVTPTNTQGFYRLRQTPISP